MTTNLNTLSEQILNIEKMFSEMVAVINSTKEQISTIQKEQIAQQYIQKKESEMEEFHNYLVDVVTEATGDIAFSKLAVGMLNRIRTTPQMTYQSLVCIYRDIDENDIVKRQAMLTLSKVYRYKFSHVKDSKIKSEIKYATKCPHCGEMAQKLVNRLRADGIHIG
jgi:hypothetical protein